MQGPLRGFHLDLYKSFSQGSVTDLGHDLHARNPKGILHDRHKRTCRCRRGSYRILIQKPCKQPRRAFIQVPLIHGICKSFRNIPLERISPGSTQRASYKDLYKIMQGPVRQDFTRTSSRFSHKDLYEIMQGLLHKIFS